MTKLKKAALAIGTVCAFAFTGGIATLNAFPAAAAETKAAGERGYYGKQLTEIAGAFYDELVEMTLPQQGGGLSEFRTGASHSVDAKVILDEAASYAAGGTNLAKQFGAALDSFRYDYAELFYLDFDRINFSVAKVAETDPEPTTPGGESEPEAQADEGGTETTEPGDGDGDDTEIDPPAAEPAYTVTIGAGRAVSYFLYDLTAEELNKEGGIFAQYTEHKTTLMNEVKAEIEKLGASSVKDQAIAVNQWITKNFSYGFDFYTVGNMNGVNRFVNTTNSIVPANNNAACFASSEGLARVYKMIMNELNPSSPIACELVSGYILVNGNVTRTMWNYVQDEEGEWYAVDVGANMVKANNNKYLYLSGELFYLDHYEDGVVSLSNHKLNYPDLFVNNYNVDTGVIGIANGTYEGREGIAVEYKGTDGTLAFRVQDEDGVWSGWTTLEAYLVTDGPDAEKEPEETPSTTPEEPAALAEEPTEGDGTEPGDGNENTGDNTGDNPDNTGNGTEGGGTGNEGGNEGENPATPTTPAEPEAPTYNIAKVGDVYYLFNLTDGAFQIGILDGDDKLIEYSETVRESLGGIVPVVLEANDVRRTIQNIYQELSVEITYPVALTKIDSSADVTVDFTVSSPLGNPFEEEFVKQYCTVKDVVWAENTRTLTFKFKPSSLLEHNGLRYSFIPTNLESESHAVPQTYPVVFRFNEIRAGGVFAGSNLYTDIVTQPTLAFNNDLSLDGWTYNGSTKVTDNMRSTLALSVSKPAATTDAEITEAVKNAVANSSDYMNGYISRAYSANENYILKLTMDGKSVTVAENTYVKLAFPYPAAHGPEDMSVVYKVIQFMNDAEGKIDYENYEIHDVVALRQGLVVAVNSFTTFALVTLNNRDLNNESIGNQFMRAVLTETTGVGGTITADTNKPVNVIMSTSSEDAVVYTIKADIGYKLDFLMVNGVKRTDFTQTTEGTADTAAVYSYKLLYVPLVLNNGGAPMTSAYNVIRVEFAPADAEEAATEVANAATEVYMKGQLNRAPYTDTEKETIIRDYPAGGAVFVPTVPPDNTVNTKSTTMQLIIVACVVGAFVVIGAIVIIYCGAIRPKIVREREEEAARIAANRERRANRNRIQPMNNLPAPRDPQNPMKK